MESYTSPQSDSNIKDNVLSGYKIQDYISEKGRIDSVKNETYKREKLKEILQNTMRFE